MSKCVEMERGRAVFEDVGEVGVGGVEGHVVGDDVLQPPHPRLSRLLGQSLEVLRGAQLRIEGRGVDHVVAVAAPRAGAEDGGGVEVR